MANNRYSATCSTISSFDVYLKENYFPINSNGGVCNIRGTIADNYSDREEFSPERINEITSKLDKGVENLTSTDLDFISEYAKAAKELLREKKFQEKIRERLAKAGVRRNAVSTMYATFKEKFPAEYREDILNQTVAAIINMLDMMEDWEEYEHLSRAEIIEDYGVSDFMDNVRDYIKECFDTIPNPTDEQKQIAEALFTDPEALEAVFYMARTKLFEAEKIKIGLDTETVEEEDEGTQFDTEEIQDAETQGAEHWMLKTDTISSFNSMSKENRSILYKLTTDTIGILGLPEIIDTMLVYQQLMELREEYACTNSSEFLQALRTVDAKWAVQLYDMIKDNPWRRTSFFNACRKNHLNYVSLNKKYDRKTKGVTYYENTNKDNPENSYQVYLAQMYHIEDKNRCLFDKNGDIISSRVKELRNKLMSSQTINGTEIQPVYVVFEGRDPVYIIENWNASIGKDPLNPTEQEVKEKKLDFINTINRALNLHMDKSEIDSLMEPSKFDSFLKNTITLICRDMSDVRVKNISNLVDNTVFANHLKAITVTAKPHVSITERKSPTEKSFRFNKSTYMTHTVCNHVGDVLERISKKGKEAVKAKDINIFKKFIEEEFLKCRVYATKVGDDYVIHNMWLRELYNSTLEDLESDASFFSKFTRNFERAVGMDDKDFEDFNEKENYILCLNSYVRTWLGTGKKFGRFPLFVTGDSNSTRFITAPVMGEDFIKESFIDIAKQELERMQMFEDIISWCNKQGYNPPKSVIKNSKSFTILPFLNGKEGKNIVSLYKDYINEDDASKKAVKEKEFEDKLRELINSHLDDSFKRWTEELRTQKSEKDKPLVNAYDDKLNSSTFTVFNKDVNINEEANLLREYYLNYRYAMVQQLQLLTVDPGFYEGTNDMQKRYKEMIAAGTPLDLEALDPSDPSKKIDDNNGRQDVVYIEEQKFPSQEEVLDALEEAKGPDGKSLFDRSDYETSTATDGQAWRSFKSYRKIMTMLGKWTPEMEEVWTIIQGARARAKATGTKSRLTTKNDTPNGEDGELERILALGVVFQPIKPFYYGIEKIDTKGGGQIHIPVQHKCSEFPIIPELLPENSKLAALGEALEDDSNGRKSYDLAICTSAVKVGNFGAANIEGLSDAESIRGAIDKGYRHELSLEGWREQSNVPEHADCSRARGTQLILHWLSNIAGTLNVKYPFLKKAFPSGKIKLTKESEPIDVSKGLNEGSLLMLYNSLASNGFVKSCIKAVQELGNPNKMSDLLSNLKANDSRAANDGIDAFTTNDEGEMNVSPCEGVTAKDNVAALMSYIRKHIIKQGMKGGSLVQVSTYGFQDVLKIHTKKTPDGKTNITYADCVTCFDFSVTDENGNLIKLKYTDYVDHATGNLLKADGTAFTDEEIDKDENWRSKTKLEHDYPGILDMLAYRIPTEGHCSILNLKARKFLPITAGAVIIVPALYTTIAGFDFDIDKLYFIRKEYRAKKLTKNERKQRINRIWNDIYGKPNNKSKGTSKIYKRLAEARDAAEAKRREGEDEVVARSSNSGVVTLGDIPEMQKLYAAMNLDSSSEKLEEEEVTTEEENAEEAEETAALIKEHERLYQYWEEAGLSAPPNEDGTGGVGMTAQEYFEKFVSDNILKYTKFQECDENKTLLEQPQAVINNLLFDFYRARLEDYSTFQERYTPSGFQNLRDAKPIMLTIRYAEARGLKDRLVACTTFNDLLELAKEFKDYIPEYDATEPSTLVHYQTQNALYDKLIGISANQNINQKFTSLMEKFRLKRPIKFGSMFDSKDSDMGRDVKKRYMDSVNPLTGKEAILDTEGSSRENLAASVDAVKEALLEFFGITLNNFNIASFMGKIGATPVDIGMLFNQPVIQIAMGIIDSSTGYTDLSDALYKALEELTDKETFEKEIKNTLPSFKTSNKESKSSTSLRDKYLTLDALTRGIAMYAAGKTDGDEFIKTQVAVISLMQDLQVAATILSDEINVTKTTSVNFIESDFGSVEATEQKASLFDLQLKKAGETEKANSSTLVQEETAEDDFPFEVEVTSTSPSLRYTIIDPNARIHTDNIDSFMNTYMKSAFGLAQAAYSAVMTFMDDVINRYFPYRSTGFKEFKTNLSTFTNRNKLNADMINVINKFLPTYFLERMVPEFMEKSRPEIVGHDSSNPIVVDIPKRIFYKRFFAEFLLKTMAYNQELLANGKDVIDYSKIPILQYITPKRENTRKSYANSNLVLKAYNIGSLQKKQKDIYIESWEQMFKSDDPILNNIAVHLFMYSYFVGGFDFGPTTFMSLVPLALKVAFGKNEDVEGSGYANFFNRLFNITVSEDGTHLIEAGSLGESSFSLKQAIKTFLANYCTQFTQFTKFVYSKDDDLYNIISERTGGGTKFTVDFTGDDGDDLALRGLITETITYKIKGKKIKNYKVKPCIVVMTDDVPVIYMCDTNWNDDNDINFNVCNGTITYTRINTPIGKDNSDVKEYNKDSNEAKEFEAFLKGNAAQAAVLLEEQFREALVKPKEDLGSMEDKKETEVTVEDMISSALDDLISSILTLVNHERPVPNDESEDQKLYYSKLKTVFSSIQVLIGLIRSEEASIAVLSPYVEDKLLAIVDTSSEKLVLKEMTESIVELIRRVLSVISELLTKKEEEKGGENSQLKKAIDWFNKLYLNTVRVVLNSYFKDWEASSRAEVASKLEAAAAVLQDALGNDVYSASNLNAARQILEEIINDNSLPATVITRARSIVLALDKLESLSDTSGSGNTLKKLSDEAGDLDNPEVKEQNVCTKKNN